MPLGAGVLTSELVYLLVSVTPLGAVVSVTPLGAGVLTRLGHAARSSCTYSCLG